MALWTEALLDAGVPIFAIALILADRRHRAGPEPGPFSSQRIQTAERFHARCQVTSTLAPGEGLIHFKLHSPNFGGRRKQLPMSFHLGHSKGVRAMRLAILTSAIILIALQVACRPPKKGQPLDDAQCKAAWTIVSPNGGPSLKVHQRPRSSIGPWSTRTRTPSSMRMSSRQAVWPAGLHPRAEHYQRD